MIAQSGETRGGGTLKVVGWLACVLLVVLALAFSALTLGGFAALSPDSPLLLRSLGSAQTVLSEALGLARAEPFIRAVGYAVFTSLLWALAAYIKPR